MNEDQDRYRRTMWRCLVYVLVLLAIAGWMAWNVT